MAKKVKSAVHELLSSLRGMTLCAVAVWGLYRGMPYPVLLFRLLALWAALSLASLLVETLLQFFAYRVHAIAENDPVNVTTATNAATTRSTS